ncbi:MAG: hypothetical protein H0T43_10960 [Solirubrobacterales bacterium]|nr:hypothetical protein [Solirubrobacterales bacterium]
MNEFGFSPQPDHTRQARHIVLPSGRTIEVVSFEETAEETAAHPAAPLHVCPECRCELAYPTHWEEEGDTHWQVSRRCPGCEWTGSGLYEQEAVERFDEELDRGTEAVMRDLRQLARANMEDDIERFTCALQGGHLLPEDF